MTYERGILQTKLVSFTDGPGQYSLFLVQEMDSRGRLE
jgi:hypothetical protein